MLTEHYVQNRYLAVPMETRGIVASWQPQAGSFDVFVSTQSPHDVRTVTSRITGVPESRIRVQMGDVGGGFGQKAYLARDEQIVVLASYHLGKPLKWIEDRRENLLAATTSRAECCTVTVAADQEGKILGIGADHLDEVGAYPQAGSAAAMGAVIFTGPYCIPKLAFESQSAFTNTCSRAPYRGPWQFETYFREQAVDSLARRLGMDPLELRRRNVLQHDELPYTLPLGIPLFDVSPAETLEQAASIVDYDAFPRVATGAARGRTPPGVGIGLYIEPQSMIGPYSTEPAHIESRPDGTVGVYLGSGSHGQGLETTTAQLVSEFLGVPFDDISVHQGDTNETPYTFGTGGSRSGPILGAAIQGAAQRLRQKVTEIAAHLMEAAPEDIAIVDGIASVRGTPTQSRTVADIAHTAYLEPGSLPPGMEPGLEVLHRYTSDQLFVFSNACHLCTVEIDPHTGVVTLLRYIVSEDCGVMINPSIVEGQIAGGAVQGIGGVLLEDFVYDDQGNPLTSTFMDYLLHRDRRARDRVRPHRDARVDARSLQGGRRRRRHRSARRGGQHGERRALAGRCSRRRRAVHAGAHRRSSRRGRSLTTDSGERHAQSPSLNRASVARARSTTCGGSVAPVRCATSSMMPTSLASSVVATCRRPERSNADPATMPAGRGCHRSRSRGPRPSRPGPSRAVLRTRRSRSRP